MPSSPTSEKKRLGILNVGYLFEIHEIIHGVSYPLLRHLLQVSRLVVSHPQFNDVCLPTLQIWGTYLTGNKCSLRSRKIENFRTKKSIKWYDVSVEFPQQPTDLPIFFKYLTKEMGTNKKNNFSTLVSCPKLEVKFFGNGAIICLLFF